MQKKSSTRVNAPAPFGITAPVPVVRVGTRRLSENGFGLVEVMIAAVVMTIVALGISSVFSDMFSMQNRANATQSINLLRSALIQAIQDGNSWQRTVQAASNTDLVCLRDSTPCTKDVSYAFDLRYADDTEAFNSKTATQGFTKDGVLCSTLGLAYPSGACPFRWDLSLIYRCSTAAAGCINPTVEVTGVLVVDPAYTGFGGGFSPAKYRIAITRGANAIKNDGIVVRYVQSTGGAPQPEPGGSCKGTWRVRALNQVQDQANNITNKTVSGDPNFVALSTANQVTFRAGTYSCRASAPAFKAGANSIRLRSTAGTILAESGVAMAAVNGGASNAYIETTMTFNADTTVLLEHFCANEPSEDADGTGEANPAYSTGYPLNTGSYDNAVFSTISCQRTS